MDDLYIDWGSIVVGRENMVRDEGEGGMSAFGNDDGPKGEFLPRRTRPPRSTCPSLINSPSRSSVLLSFEEDAPFPSSSRPSPLPSSQPLI